MFTILITIFALRGFVANAEDYESPWHYKCIGGHCKKGAITPEVRTPLSLEVCQLFCGEAGALWPKPTGHMSLGNFVAHLDPVGVTLKNVLTKSRVGELLQRNVDILKENAIKMGNDRARNGGTNMEIYVSGIENFNDAKLTLNTKENYSLKIRQQDENLINATIIASTYHGARNGLQTLSQLIVYDDLRNEIQVVRDADITDGPVYPYRGILLDTSRNFIDKASILRTIEAMGMSKLNTFHWHITDSHSFPYASRAWPEFSKYGAYGPRKVYRERDIREIVEHGLLHGVRVLPEFDAPAHVGEGWQWAGNGTVVCFAAEPWRNYCVEPPCGQLNPTNPRVYDILGGLYADMLRDFGQPDIFHMGGDEVNIECWRSAKTVTDWMTMHKWNLTDASFYELWSFFQETAYQKLRSANRDTDIPVILWTSGLTGPENVHLLHPSKYIVQIWTTGSDPTISRLLNNNLRIIFSNYDALYFDCGFGAWVGEGNNWCSPYIGWQKVYDNSPLTIIKKQRQEDKKHLILGGEATLWSEQVDGTSVDSRLWPRGAALAERLWAEPQSSWIHAEQRMLRHRERLVQRGIHADALEPEWCSQNQGGCYL